MVQRGPATTISPEGPRVPGAKKKKYPMALQICQMDVEHLNIPAYFKLTNPLHQLLVHAAQGYDIEGETGGPTLSYYL